MCFKDRVWFGLCHFLVIAHVIFFHAVPVPGDNITPPLYKSTKSFESLLQAEWQQIISWSFHTAKYFQPWYDISWHHVMLKVKNRHGVYWRLDCYLLCCALVTKVFVKQILMVDHILEYKGHSISNQPTLFPIKIDRFFFSKNNLYQDTFQSYVWNIYFLMI